MERRWPDPFSVFTPSLTASVMISVQGVCLQGWLAEAEVDEQTVSLSNWEVSPLGCYISSVYFQVHH